MKECSHTTNKIIFAASTEIENGIACEAGEYKDFSGIIIWGDNESVVENATFNLEEYPTLKLITFHSGVWHDGIWWGGTWENGIWESGTWEDGNWKNGIWNHGKWLKGTWHSGVWQDGIWEWGVWDAGFWFGGIWKKGFWKEGFDSSSKSHSDSPNLWNK